MRGQNARRPKVRTDKQDGLTGDALIGPRQSCCLSFIAAPQFVASGSRHLPPPTAAIQYSGYILPFHLASLHVVLGYHHIIIVIDFRLISSRTVHGKRLFMPASTLSRAPAQFLCPARSH